ncbi:MAG: SCO1664 family protein [Jatrophihabitantaceae bacterium]
MAPTDALELLRRGDLAIEGRLVAASNSTLYCSVTADGVTAACVYKPVAGERPLWDFPDGTLAEREVAAFEVSAASGWDIVPPTVHRDGPAGPGMVQLWIGADEDIDLIALLRSRDNDRLRRIAVFDALINNSDRKGGHLLPTADGHVYGVDHGVTFHVDDKLRTVLWQWADQPLTDEAIDVLSGLRESIAGALGERLRELLTTQEVRKTTRRLDRLLSVGLHPEPSGDWPPVPWPPM